MRLESSKTARDGMMLRLDQAGALHSQSPVVAVMSGDEDTLQPMALHRCPVLLTSRTIHKEPL